MLEGILSAAAARLYDDLRRGKSIAIDPDELTAVTEETAARELYRRGLVTQTYDDPTRLVAMSPREAISASITSLIDQLAEDHRSLLRAVDEALRVQSENLPGDDAPAVTVLTDLGEINFLSGSLTGSARREAKFFNTPHAVHTDRLQAVGLTQRQRTNSVSLRSVYHSDCLPDMIPLIEESIRGGEQARISTDVPLKMIMVDDSKAMLPLDSTGTKGALLVEAPPILAALGLLFEWIWLRAVPYPSQNEHNELTPIEERVITLLVLGSKDELIAQRLNVTVRTVRRHITAAMVKLGTDNRFAAGVLAAKRGWI